MVAETIVINDSQRLAWLLAWMQERGLLVRYEIVAKPDGTRGSAWTLRAPFVVGQAVAFGPDEDGPAGAIDAAMRLGRGV